MSCKETFDVISKWVDYNFFFSKDYGWSNMAIVGLLGDYVLHSINGDILEIGVGESSIYMSALAKKFKRNVYFCDSHEDKINDIKKSGYLEGKVYCMSSDQMFEKHSFTPLAFSFIDGYHSYEQAKRDFWNVEKYTVSNGYILLHDTYPPSNLEVLPSPKACGEVYKLRQELEQNKLFDCFTFAGNSDNFKASNYYIASTLVRKKPINRPYYQE